MTTLSSRSARTTSRAARKATQSAWFHAFRLSGRLSVIRATPASSSRSRTSSGHSLSFRQTAASDRVSAMQLSAHTQSRLPSSRPFTLGRVPGAVNDAKDNDPLAAGRRGFKSIGDDVGQAYNRLFVGTSDPAPAADRRAPETFSGRFDSV